MREHLKNISLVAGIDIGSTTIKGLVVDIESDTILWQWYERHETRVVEKFLEVLRKIEEDLNLGAGEFFIYMTGSGANNLYQIVNAKYVQEVHAISLIVEKYHPEVHSIIELGGQDAKMIFFKELHGKRKKYATMNDKCAGGTGAVIDKIIAKLNISHEEIQNLRYNGVKLHQVAGKCGVFAETDINSLQKQGIPKNELIASLFESIVQQNLSVLTRGNTLYPEVLLLGGPNTFLPGLVEAWQDNIPRIWEERKIHLPENIDPKSLIKVPLNSEYYAALGAIEFFKTDTYPVCIYKGLTEIVALVESDRRNLKSKFSGMGLVNTKDELKSFIEEYKIPEFKEPEIIGIDKLDVFIGLDGGSTSTKAVILNKNKELVAKEYRLSKGNPIEDTREIFKKFKQKFEMLNVELNVLGVGVTGYAKDILKDCIGADVALVETVAHMKSALHYFEDVDVICDVGGQDIKIIILKDKRVVDFKLNTQCSAGNGYFLQATAESLGIDVNQYAEVAFKAKRAPEFSYGCAVFLQSDIVDFQRQGWKPEEILAGLAKVLPKNIWLYIAQMPNMAKYGSRFVLQGGTQYNLAAVKAQIDFIKERFANMKINPLIKIHPHTGESGAIGVALEALENYQRVKRSNFIGFDAIESIKYETKRDEETKCYFCKNQCLRTFIDIITSLNIKNDNSNNFPFKHGPEQLRSARVEFAQFTVDNQDLREVKKERIIIATCEKGTVENAKSVQEIQKKIDDIKNVNPNLVEFAAKKVWEPTKPKLVSDQIHIVVFTKKAKIKRNLKLQRDSVVIGIPRLLNLYSFNPFFSAYFESLGIKPGNIIYSDFTSEKLFKEGSRRGTIDPCYPSKLAMAHIHNLLFVHHKKKKLDYIFFPSIDSMPSDMQNCVDHRGCPTAVATPFSTYAAFTREKDIFEEFGVGYLNPFLNMGEPKLLELQLFEYFEYILGLTKSENKKAVECAYKALYTFQDILRRKGKEVLQMLERENRIGIVVLARPYHNDPGINHGILEEFQKLGYPILSQDSLPTDEETLKKVFKDDEVHPMEISDVWKNSYSENTNRKIWAAKFVARHPNLVALELSNFRCGHDAPIYSLIQDIIEMSGKPYFCFKDIDENKPKGSIKIRIETIAYFLKEYKQIFKPAESVLQEDFIKRQKFNIDKFMITNSALKNKN